MNLGQTMINVAITGSSGFVGSEILKMLSRQDIECFTLGRHKNNDYFFSLGKHINESILDNIDLLIHSAWDFQCEKNSIFQINAIGAIPILKLAMNLKIPILNLSSLAAHEHTISQYGFSKLFLENYLSQYSLGTSIRLGVPFFTSKENRFQKLSNLSRFLPFNVIPGSKNSFIYQTLQQDLDRVVKYYIKNFRTTSGVYRVCDFNPVLISSLFKSRRVNFFLNERFLPLIEIADRVLPDGFSSDNLKSLINQISSEEFYKLRVFPGFLVT